MTPETSPPGHDLVPVAPPAVLVDAPLEVVVLVAGPGVVLTARAVVREGAAAVAETADVAVPPPQPARANSNSAPVHPTPSLKRRSMGLSYSVENRG
jgi:hypothetical protein